MASETVFTASRRGFVALLALALSACGGAEDGASDAPSPSTGQNADPDAPARTVESESALEREAEPAPQILRAVDAFTLDAPVRSIALWRHPNLPFESRILIAHGDQGLSILSLEGQVLWRDRTPADVVAVTIDTARTYAQAGENGSVLTTYRIPGDGERLERAGEPVAPSPVAATTLLRTNFADVGPLAIRGGALVDGDGDRVPLDQEGDVLAASAANFGGVYRRGILAVGDETGGLRLYALTAAAGALGLALPAQEGPTRGTPRGEGASPAALDLGLPSLSERLGAPKAKDEREGNGE